MAFDPKKLGTAAPKVEWDDLEEDVAVLTIASFEEGEIEDAEKEGGMRSTAFLTFEELGDKRIYLGVRQGEAIVHHYGNEPTAWIGRQVPVEKARRKFGNKTFDKVIVVEDPEEWSQYIDLPRRTKTVKVEKAAAKKIKKIKGAKPRR